MDHYAWDCDTCTCVISPVTPVPLYTYVHVHSGLLCTVCVCLNILSCPPDRIVMIGDGMTDMEASPPAVSDPDTYQQYLSICRVIIVFVHDAVQISYNYYNFVPAHFFLHSSVCFSKLCTQ